MIVRRLSAALAAFTLAGAGALIAAAPAHADPLVTAAVADRPELSGVADDTYVTELTLSGSGFQSIANGFGGIYVLFGAADDGWRPSEGGKSGTDYRYAFDDEADPQGFQVFVAFPGAETGASANGGEIAADGTWTATIAVPGPVFASFDRAGEPTTVDCTQTECGIITVGAHGVTNPSNETFTPISFDGIYTEADGHPLAADVAPAPVETETDAAETPDAAAAPESAGDTGVTPLAWLAAVGALLAIGAVVAAVIVRARRGTPGESSGR